MSNQDYNELIIPVPYHSQRDNMYFPKATCGSTCLGMILEYLNTKRKLTNQYIFDDDAIMKTLASEELVRKVISIDSNYKNYAKKRPDPITGKPTEYNHMNNVFIALALAGEILCDYEYLFKIKYRYIYEIEDTLKNGRPIQILGRFKISPNRSINHYILIIGMDSHNYICHDPYGDWYQKYNNHNGSFVRYRKQDLLKAISNRGGLTSKDRNNKILYFSMKPVPNKYFKEQ